MLATSEQRARTDIERPLPQAGWLVQDAQAISLNAARPGADLEADQGAERGAGGVMRCAGVRLCGANP